MIVKAKIFHDEKEYHESKTPGDTMLWHWSGKSGRLLVRCPGCGDEGSIHVRAEGEPHPSARGPGYSQPSWELTGLAGRTDDPRDAVLTDRVSTTPSINCVGCCGWHGYLTNGEFRT